MAKVNQDSIDALVAGLKDGGCTYVTNFPGFNSQGIFTKLGGKQISINERVAFEFAYGASMAGKRSVVTFKGVGLNVASDPFLHAILNGINAGMVVVLTDDIEAVSSPESQDSRPFRDIFGGLWLEPAGVQEAYEFGRSAFEWSERFDMPVVIRLTNQFFELKGVYSKKEISKNNNSIEKDRDKYISYWKKRNSRLQKRLTELGKFTERFAEIGGKSTKTFGLIILGNCQRELCKFDLKKYGVLRLSAYPIHEETIEKFCKNKSKIIVLEQGRNYAFQQIKAILGGNFELDSQTGDRPDRSKEWMIWNNLEKLFSSLKSINPSFVVGDEGTFTDESTQTIRTCLCMGASIGISAGMVDNGVSYPFCVIGDTSFTFSGQQTLIEAKERGLSFGVIVIDNGGARSTGGQKKIGDIYSIDGIPSATLNYDKTSKEDFILVLSKMRNKGKLAILYVQEK